MVGVAVNRVKWEVMGGRQSSQGGTSTGNTRQSTGQASVPVEESRADRNSTGTNTSRDSSNVDVSRTDQPHGRPVGERRREGSSSHSLRVTGRSSRPSSSYAEGARSVRERVRILPTPTTYSSSAPSTNQPLDISLLLGFRNVSISNVSITSELKWYKIVAIKRCTCVCAFTEVFPFVIELLNQRCIIGSFITFRAWMAVR